MAIMRVLCAAIALVQAVNGQNCNADNCLRAVRATNMGTKGATDCAAFFRATVTPSTMTFTATSYATVTPLPVTSTLSTTQTITPATVTQTTTIGSTATPDPVTAVALSTSTIVVGPPPVTITVTPLVPKRQVTQTPTTIPAYASACSGTARYSTACSCIGAIRSTITVAAPSTTTTQTVLVSATASTVTVTELASTTLQTSTTVITSNSVSTLDPSTIITTSILLTTTTTIPSTTSSAAPIPTCTTTQFVSGNAFYGRFFVGSGVHDPTVIAHRTTFIDTGNDCQPLQACFQYQKSWGNSGHFTLQFNLLTNVWDCLSSTVLTNAPYNTPDPNVGRVYAFVSYMV